MKSIHEYNIWRSKYNYLFFHIFHTTVLIYMIYLCEKYSSIHPQMLFLGSCSTFLQDFIESDEELLEILSGQIDKHM